MTHLLDMTENVSATPLNCSNRPEIFRTNEALNLMTANPNTNTAARESLECGVEPDSNVNIHYLNHAVGLLHDQAVTRVSVQ